MLHCDWASGRLSKLAVLIESRSARLRADGHKVRLRGLADHCCCTLRSYENTINKKILGWQNNLLSQDLSFLLC